MVAGMGWSGVTAPTTASVCQRLCFQSGVSSLCIPVVCVCPPCVGINSEELEVWCSASDHFVICVWTLVKRGADALSVTEFIRLCSSVFLRNLILGLATAWYCLWLSIWFQQWLYRRKTNLWSLVRTNRPRSKHEMRSTATKSAQPSAWKKRPSSLTIASLNGNIESPSMWTVSLSSAWNSSTNALGVPFQKQNKKSTGAVAP